MVQTGKSVELVNILTGQYAFAAVLGMESLLAVSLYRRTYV